MNRFGNRAKKSLSNSAPILETSRLKQVQKCELNEGSRSPLSDVRSKARRTPPRLFRASHALRRAEDSARRTVGYFDQRLQGGMIAYLDVAAVQRKFRPAECASVQNRGARYSSTVQLIKSLSGGWCP